MPRKKTLQEREKELQTLLATTAGRMELQELASRYLAANNSLASPRKSPITYILVHERLQGMISVES
jgi:hypothetical protein